MKVLSTAMKILSTIVLSQLAAAQEPFGLKAELFPDPAKVPNLTPDHGFGWSLDFSGDTLIVGSYRAGKFEWETSTYGAGGGSARVFVRADPDSNLEWIQQGPPLVVNDPDYSGEYVGYRVAIDGDTALVSATRGEFGAAKLVVFRRFGNTWTQDQILPGDDVPDDGLIPRVALEGDLAVIGRPFPSSGIGSGSANGKVIILKRTGPSWTDAITYTVEASDKRDGDYFGADVAISEGRILVGADERGVWDSVSGTQATIQKGKAYVLVFDGTNWIEEQILIPDSNALHDRFHFGAFVALDNDTALIGNNAYQGNCDSPIPVYGFTRNADGSWEKRVIDSKVYFGVVCSFGRGVSLKGNRALLEVNGNMILLEEWATSNWQYLHPHEHYGYTDYIKNGNRMRLDTNVAFFGMDRGIQSTAEVGSVHVYDNFSVLPIGPEQFTFINSWSYPGTFQFQYAVGHGQPIQEELLLTDCLGTITDISFSKGEYAQMKNLTHDFFNLYYSYDAKAIQDSAIFNSDTWEVQFCHKVGLLGSVPALEETKVLTLDVELKPQGVVGGSFGDTHIMTFDQMKFDCQAAGVFTTLTSLEDPTFEIQERFTAASSSSCHQASVSTGVVLKDGNKPVIQISTPGLEETSLNQVNGCPIDFYVDNAASILDVTDPGSNVLVKLDSSYNRIKIIHTDTYVTVDVKVSYSSTFGCFFMVQVYLPETFRSDETLLGLLGLPNGNIGDDWVSISPEGTVNIIQAPATEQDRLFSTAYNYCVTSWCQDEPNSLFKLRSGETFDFINKCDVAYSGNIEATVRSIADNPSQNQVVSDICKRYDDFGELDLDLSCVVDSLCGDVSDAHNAMNDASDLINKRNQVLKYSQYPSLVSMEGSEWDVKAQIFAVNPDGLPDFGFGWSVALSGDTFIAGSYNDAEYDWQTDTYGPGQGSARIFKRSSVGSQVVWEQQGDPLVVKDLDDIGAKYVGYRVAIDGDTVLISATKGIGGVSRLFVFELTETGWEQSAMLHIDNEYIDDGRIPQVALEGDTAIFGRGHGFNGKVFVYTKSGLDWSNPNVQELYASDGADGDYFGADVAISGNSLLVGASQQNLLNDDGSIATVRKGKVYAFVKSNLGQWEEEDILLCPWTYDQLQFGASIALEGDTALIGHDNFWGFVSVFNRNSGDWKFLEAIMAPPDSWDAWSFGKSVSIYGDQAIVGSSSGEATILKRSRFGLWIVADVVKSIGWNYVARLGRNVAIGTDIALVGTDNGEFQEGTVQVLDAYSLIPFGLETITPEYNYTYPTPDGHQLGTTFSTGYGYEVHYQVLQKDCSSTITNPPFTVFSNEYRKSLLENLFSVYISFDSNTIESSIIYSEESWEIEICVVVDLKESDVKFEQIFKIPHAGSNTPPGPEEILFTGSWTNGNRITTNYQVGRLREHEAVLLQKDCETPITDTSISSTNNTYSLDLMYDGSQFFYTLDPTTIRNSVIFNATMSRIEVCHIVHLTNNTLIINTQIISINVPPEGTVAGLFGDPHIMTFDGIQFDCQAAGEFTTLTSLDDPSFKIQERFTAIESTDASTCALASVSTGVAFVDAGKPIIQISTPRSGKTALNSVNECPIDFYVNRTAYRVGSNLTSTGISVTLEGTNQIKIKHEDTLVTLQVAVHKSLSFGCHIMVQVALPGLFRSGETLLGLLGTPNGNKNDDWMATDGSVLALPTNDMERLFSKAYDYCRLNWCAQDSADSLFTYGIGESFEDIYKCNIPFLVEVEEAVQEIVKDPSTNQILSDLCGDNLECLVDGLCGDITDASAALSNKQVIVSSQEEVKESIFQLEQIEVKDIQSVSSQPSSAPTPRLVSTTPRPSNPPSTSSSTLLDGYFGRSVYDLEFATEYLVTITIKGTRCKVGNDESDFTNTQIKAIESALATGFCDKENFPSGSCFTLTKTVICKDAQVAPRQFRGRKLVDDTENNDLVITFVVSVVGQCVNYDCSDGYARMQAVGDTVKEYSGDNLSALVSALKVADLTLFANVSILGLSISYGNLQAPLLEKYMKWYPRWGTKENTCSNDGRYEPYMESTKFVRDSLENCCNAYYSWAFDDCMVLGGAEVSKSALTGFYVDYITNSCKQSCFKKNATATKNCGGIAPKWMEIFENAEECCRTKLFWTNQATCIALSTNNIVKDEEKGSKKWYVDWTVYKCVKDCEKDTGSSCGGIANHWDQMFDTADECCNSKLSWVKHSQCTTSE